MSEGRPRPSNARAPRSCGGPRVLPGEHELQAVTRYIAVIRARWLQELETQAIRRASPTRSWDASHRSHTRTCRRRRASQTEGRVAPTPLAAALSAPQQRLAARSQPPHVPRKRVQPVLPSCSPALRATVRLPRLHRQCSSQRARHSTREPLREPRDHNIDLVDRSGGGRDLEHEWPPSRGTLLRLSAYGRPSPIATGEGLLPRPDDSEG